MDAATITAASLMGASALSGIAGSLSGNSSRRRRQRAIQRSYNNHADRQQEIYQPLTQSLMDAANEAAQARQSVFQAMNSAARAEEAGRQQGQLFGAIMQAQQQNPVQEGTQRSQSASQSQQGAAAETAEKAMLLNTLLGAQAAAQGRGMFDQQAQAAGAVPIMELMQGARGEAAVADEAGALNDLELQRNLARLSGPVNNDFAEGMNLLSQLTGAGSVIAGQFGGGQQQQTAPELGLGGQTTFQTNQGGQRGYYDMTLNNMPPALPPAYPADTGNLPLNGMIYPVGPRGF